MKYIRFQTSIIDEASHAPKGLFQLAYKLRDSGLPEYHYEYLKTLLKRFDDNLDKPDQFGRKKSYTGSWTKGISWYQITAKEHIEKTRELARIMQEYDIYTEEIKTDTPGYIVYEDDIQIVAERYRQTTE